MTIPQRQDRRWRRCLGPAGNGVHDLYDPSKCLTSSSIQRIHLLRHLCSGWHAQSAPQRIHSSTNRTCGNDGVCRIDFRPQQRDLCHGSTVHLCDFLHALDGAFVRRVHFLSRSLGLPECKSSSPTGRARCPSVGAGNARTTTTFRTQSLSMSTQ